MPKSQALATNIVRGETVILYPTFGHLVDEGRNWRIHVRGTVYEPGQLGLRRRILIRLLQRAMKASRDDLDSDIFRQRIRGFLADTEKGKRVAVRIGGRAITLRKATNRNGDFAGIIRVSVDEAAALQPGANGHDSWLHLEAVGPGVANGHAAAPVQLLKDRGISVISDIDDTIKHSDVGSRRELLTNTFLQEFRPVEGMADLYQAWSQRGAAFHYVSSSPWQLYQPLEELCRTAGFPSGSFHLRSFRLRDHMLRRVPLIRRKGKAAVIKEILHTFPERQFALIGDSGEKDPEIYADLARKFPDRVAAILIRSLPARSLDKERQRKVLRRIPPERLVVFRHPEEVTDCLPTRK
jgi:phosphatidate phosphatase APP1